MPQTRCYLPIPITGPYFALSSSAFTETGHKRMRARNATKRRDMEDSSLRDCVRVGRRGRDMMKRERRERKKAEKRRRKQEKKQRRKLKEAERKYALYVTCVPIEP